MKRKMVNLYRIACQTFLFFREKEKILNIGIWFYENNESWQMTDDKK